jgi:hypothetical protein
MLNILFMTYFRENKTLTEKELEDRFYSLY